MMQYPSTTIKIHAAAFYFVYTSRDLHEIANVFGVTEYAVRKWAKTPQWEKALDVFGYTGDRDFITKPTRDTVRDAGESVGLSRRRIHAWAQQYGWRDLIHTNDRQTGGIDL